MHSRIRWVYILDRFILLACIIRRILYSCNLFIKCVVVMAYEQD